MHDICIQHVLCLHMSLLARFGLLILKLCLNAHAGARPGGFATGQLVGSEQLPVRALQGGGAALAAARHSPGCPESAPSASPAASATGALPSLSHGLGTQPGSQGLQSSVSASALGAQGTGWHKGEVCQGGRTCLLPAKLWPWSYQFGCRQLT